MATLGKDALSGPLLPSVWIGAGMHHYEGDALTRYRDAAVDDRAGKALVAAMEQAAIDDALDPDFGDQVLTHFRATWSIAKWLLEEVVGDQ